VLLRGVNDDPESLEALMRGFVECRIKTLLSAITAIPRAGGLRICERRLAKGQEIMRALRGRVSGLCQPDFVVDIPGGHGKGFRPAPNYLFRRKIFFPQIVNRPLKPAIVSRIIAGDVHLYPAGPVTAFQRKPGFGRCASNMEKSKMRKNYW